jgi:hypothetical protein
MQDYRIKEYSQKLDQVQSGIISEEEWMNYCKGILEEVLEDAKDVLLRIKQRGD